MLALRAHRPSQCIFGLGDPVPAGGLLLLGDHPLRCRRCVATGFEFLQRGELGGGHESRAYNSAHGNRFGDDVPHSNRLTKANAVSATSRQPLSMVNECPRPFISVISVTPSLCFCFL